MWLLFIAVIITISHLLVFIFGFRSGERYTEKKELGPRMREHVLR